MSVKLQPNLHSQLELHDEPSKLGTEWTRTGREGLEVKCCEPLKKGTFLSKYMHFSLGVVQCCWCFFWKRSGHVVSDVRYDSPNRH